MFKKIIICCLCLIFLYTEICFADEENIDEDLSQIFFGNTYETVNEISKEPLTFSKNIIVLDRKSLSILYEKNSNEIVPMASTTKIMTCILALENSSLNEIVTISKNSANIHGSTLGLKEDMQISMLDLLYGLMLRSGNDDAVT